MKFEVRLNKCLLALCLLIVGVFGQSMTLENLKIGVDIPDVPKVSLDSLHQRIASEIRPRFSNVLQSDGNPYEYEDATALLDDMNNNLTSYLQDLQDAAWIYNTNITDSNEEAMNAASASFSSMYYYWWVTELNPFNSSEVTDPYISRQFQLQESIGTAILNATDYAALSDHVNSMTDKLNNRVCPYEKQNCNLITEGLTIDSLEIIMGVAKDYKELLYYWVEWRDVSGKLMLDDYPPYVALTNEAAVGNDFNDGGQMWLNPYTGYDYTSDDFKMEIENIWQQLKPFYAKLHAYVRFQLMQNPDYSSHFHQDGLIPANILGNMYAQSWVNVYDQVAPYPDVPLIDLTPILEEKITNVTEMFLFAEDFFLSLGMYKMTPDFWDNTLYERPSDRDVICHASAWDFFSYELDNTETGRFRIKMCTNKTQEDFITIHHEMGHIEYFMAYSTGDKPLVYRDGANPGFHEAIGDTIALSVSTPAHLEKIYERLNSTFNAAIEKRNSLARAQEASQQDLNFLMKQALDKVAFLPYAYIIDLWRWDVFAGKFDNNSYNKQWWKRRMNYQGVKPPVNRTEEDFDIGCKFHVPANVPYIRYFVAVILQFQFHERLCQVSGYTGPVYNCDIYGSLDAGTALLSMLQNGNSLQWQDQLADFLNVTVGKMDASSILNYFGPLIDYLDQEIADKNISVGWLHSADVLAWHALSEMDTNITTYVQEYVQKTWDYFTDETDENLIAMNDASNTFNSMYNYWWQLAIKPIDYTTVTSPSLRRQLELQQSIGTAILNETDVKALDEHVNNMMEQLNNKVCDYKNNKCDAPTEGYTIDELEVKMGTSRGYSELLWYWEKWRDASGKKMVDDYPSYVELLNKAADGNKFTDASQMWVDPYTSKEFNYTSDEFKNEIDDLWKELQPFYEKLHAYVRYRLMDYENSAYKKYFNGDGLIPANILGNMYAQSWENIYELVAPYPDVPLIDLTPTLEAKVKDTKEMFVMAEEFFVSLGMYKMNKDFWNNTMYEQPEGKTVVCHASAMDFRSTEIDNISDGKFRIKMCTNKNQDDFITIHHEMGHIEYFMAYGNDSKPLIFRDGANPGFHEAIGDTISLSVSTPNHLAMIEAQLNQTASKQALQGTDNTTEVSQQDINFLMKEALTKVAFLPFAYIIDQWRWEVFEGTINPSNYNSEWWQKRISYQGLRPPIKREADKDFDIGCKYHIPANVPYIRYFVAVILQFQFHERLCEIAGSNDTVYNCDIYGSLDAGAALLSMLQNGNSLQWQDQLADFLNVTDGKMDASSILNYFEPLIDFLDQEIADKKFRVGWDVDTLQDYISNGETISAIVPIIVGAVLIVLVCIVIVAFFMGQSKRKKAEKKEQEKEKAAAAAGVVTGKVNEALELNEKLDADKLDV